jgi:poly-gamma-glutamate synthesis protein (capsule biosynthesis protein)
MGRFGTFSRVAIATVAAAMILGGCARGKSVQDTLDDPLGSLAQKSDEAASSPPPPPPPALTTVRVLVGGDVLPHRPRLSDPARISAALEPLAPFFKTSDAVVVNYESATGDPDHALRMAYVAPPEWLSALKTSGVSAVTVANNHACDMGPLGMRTTLAAAHEAGLLAIGGDTHEPFAPRVIAEKDGKRVCAVAWTNKSNAPACESTATLAFAPPTRHGTAQAVDAVRRARQAGCDAIVAIFHGGDEYAPQTAAALAQAKRVAEAGADAIVMHHPHIVSPLVRYETRDGRSVPIFSSVGNLVTNQGESWKPPMFPVLREDRHLVCVNGWTRLGMLADLTFSFTPPAPGAGGGHKGLSYATHLLFIENEHAQDKKAAMPKIDVRLLSPEGDKDTIARLRDDKVGPVAVFDDPCWFEASGKRCDADLERNAPSASAANLPDDDLPDDETHVGRRARLTGARVSAKNKAK